MIQKFWIGLVDISKSPLHQQDFGSRIISFVSGSPLVHTFLVFQNDPEKNPIVYQTTNSVYERITLDKRMIDSDCFFYEIETCKALKLEEACIKILNSKYDYSGMLGIGLLLMAERVLNFIFYKLIKWLSIKDLNPEVIVIGNPIHLKRSYFCSEVIVELCRRVKLDIFPDWWDASSISPAFMNKYLSSDPIRFKRKTIIKTVVSI